MKVLVPFREHNKVGPYLAAAKCAGLDPIACLADCPAGLDNASGLLLTGGSDVNPARYGQEKRAETEPPDDDRDQIELDLLDTAIQNDVPILAICRGLQILNVYHGGTLIQHLDSGDRHRPGFPDKAKPAHEVVIEPDTRLFESVSQSRMMVNSRHHQAAGEIGAGLRVSARDPEDGVIEGLERPDKRFVVAVQWHPEDQVTTQPEQLRLFQAFARAVAGK